MLDNSDRTAPAMFNDFDELEVVRQINRGQGSTYRVNGKEVRARDVQLLFADAATGAHSTALVSQGRIGSLINAKPKDRRSLLEEAAGITGLHSRRHEAELRLRAAETNLERLDDVIATLEAQLQGLKKQARQATRYRNINGHIRRSEAILLHLEGEEGKENVAKAQEAQQLAEQAVATISQQAAASATKQAEAAACLPGLRDAEAEAAAGLQRLLVDRDQLDREVALNASAREQTRERLDQLAGDQTPRQIFGRRCRFRAAALGRGTGSPDRGIPGRRGKPAPKPRKRGKPPPRRSPGFETRLGELTAQVASDEARGAALNRRLQELTQPPGAPDAEQTHERKLQQLKSSA